MGKHFHILTCLIFLSIAVHAQLITRHHAHTGQLPPKAILVELATAINRINFYTRQKDNKNLALVMAEAAGQRESMVADFKDHFTYCPLYFFYDTMQNAIQAKDFTPLLNSDMKPATNLAISPADSNYFIVYYGYAAEETTGENNEKTYSSGSTDNSVKTLAALNPDFTTLSHKLPYKVKPVGLANAKRKNVALIKYEYQSAKFDIGYKPYAGIYSRNLTTFYGRK
jgi:hypothetical protein